MKMLLVALLSCATLSLLALADAPASAQQFLDSTNLVTGTSGSFTGILTSNTARPFREFRDANIYSSSRTPTDQIGYSKLHSKLSGGGGDGLSFPGAVVQDATPNSIVGYAVDSPPPIRGLCSAQGSVALQGTFPVRTARVHNLPPDGNRGSSTLLLSPAVEVLELSLVALLGSAASLLPAVIAVRRRTRQRIIAE